MTFRIVTYLDQTAGRCAYLRETVGDYQPHENHPFVVIAREYDETGKVTRTWFLGQHQAHDGSNPLDEHAPPHRIVDPNIVAGEESKPADPLNRNGGDLQSVLHKLKQNEIKNILAIRQHQEFCATYHDALNRAKQLEAELKTADEKVRDVAARNATLADELQHVRSELGALRQEKSLTHRIKEWGRTWSIHNG